MTTDQPPVGLHEPIAASTGSGEPGLLKLETIGLSFKDGATDEFKAIVREYFSVFAEPSGKRGDGFCFGNKCVHCGEYLTGMLGTFEWDLCYGEFRCGKCKWPGRGIHVVKDKAGEELFTLGRSDGPIPLQYLPAFVTSGDEQAEATP